MKQLKLTMKMIALVVILLSTFASCKQETKTSSEEGKQTANETLTPKYSADVPEFLLTPDKVKTEFLGDLEFFDGMPSESTVKKA
ncbi:hypothetical protein KA005_32840, partial [bacterium]|nr:hypothetical protein [bacterium]